MRRELEIMAEQKHERSGRRGAMLLTMAALATASGCKVNKPEVHLPPQEPTPTEAPFPTPSPEFIQDLEKSAQDAINSQFGGLGFHDSKLIGDTLTDALGEKRYALFESLTPIKDSSEEYAARFLGTVGEDKHIENVRLLVASEVYSEDKTIVTFAAATFNSGDHFFDIQDPYLRTNTQTGEIEITENGINWIPLLGTPFAYNEIRAKVGTGGILEPPRIPSPTPEPTSTPTSTEKPAFNGPFADIDPLKNNGHMPEFKTGLSLGGVPEYVFAPTYPMTLVSISSVPGTEITEQVWGFRTNGRDYRFRNYTAVCNIESDIIGKNMSNLEVGSQYRLLFVGFEKPFSESQLMNELAQDCKTVWGNVRGDPNDMTRLKNFFTSGDSEGLDIKNEIVDLTNVLVPSMVIP